MNKRERTQLIIIANNSIGKPYIIEANDQYGYTRYGKIQTLQDERVFINYGSSQRNWYTSDIK